MVKTGKKRPHIRKKRPSDNMDEFVRSMSIILTRLLAKAETLEGYIRNDNKNASLTEVDSIIKDAGKMIEAFSHQIK